MWVFFYLFSGVQYASSMASVYLQAVFTVKLLPCSQVDNPPDLGANILFTLLTFIALI